MSENPAPQGITRRHLIWMVVVAMVLYLFWWLPPIAARQDAVFRSFAPLVAIKTHIQKRYVEDIEDQQLIQGAIRGMMDQLDPFSAYLSPQQFPVFQQRSQGGYVGIGIQVDVDPQTRELFVSGPTDESPAFEAGVRVGDIIVEVAGKPVSRLRPFEATERLRGIEGSIAHFTIERPPDRERISFTVTRRSLVTRSVLGFMRHPDGSWEYFVDRTGGIGYVAIREFWENTPRGFDLAVQSMLDEELRALVIDVRFNPGGDMRACLEIVDRFVSSGVLLTTRTRREVESTAEASSRDDLPQFPVAVLINTASASGAEILAGVLQEHDRATVIGQRSFGKGSVQTVIPLEDGESALRLTTAYYYLPGGRCIHRRPGMVETDPWGIVPDIVVELGIGEMDLLYREMARMRVPTSPNNPPRPIEEDEQLVAALEWLEQQLPPKSAGL